jgi:transcription elongation factor SPT4
MSSGCPNCESILNLAGAPEAIAECTSANFNGMIAVTDPRKSWVAKWQRVETYVPGMYAVQVLGTLPGEIVGALEDAGVSYVPRDGSGEMGQVGEE